MMQPGLFAAAYGLDWIAGDPEWFPHPVRLIGAAISKGEQLLRRQTESRNELMDGAILTGVIVSGSWVASKAVLRAGGGFAEIVLAWTTLATRSLLGESFAVIWAVEAQDLPLARKRLARIVGRDTESLDEWEILRAVIETLSEGLCDGIVAPMFYLALGGVPLAFAYKAVNTLDSMIGHWEPPYRYFGGAAARLDDVANFVPARIAAGAICLAAMLLNRNHRLAWRIFRRDGYLHPSPNAGQSEAAMAGALEIQLGGMNYYSGLPSPKPLLCAEGRPATVPDARGALRIVAVASLVVFSLAWLVLRRRKR
jgi:adenosylcobinamide-phosphate synthase